MITRYAWEGRVVVHAIAWRRELGRDDDGRIVRAPACFGMPHPHGVCPHGRQHQIERGQAHNLVVNGFYSAVNDHLANVPGAPSAKLTHVSSGDGGAPAIPTTAELDHTRYSAALTDVQKTSDIEIVATFFFAEDASNFFIHELGLWMRGAGTLAGGGQLAAKVLYDYDKTSDITLDGEWTLRKA